MENELIARIKDLDSVAFQRNITKNTGFLSASEFSEYLAMERELSHPRRFAYGGYEDAERKMIIWPADYECIEDIIDDNAKAKVVASLIACVKAAPVNDKFSDNLTHRDFLGALMNLGIERDQIGDIILKENSAYIYCNAKLCELICDELDRVKHTSINAERVPMSECDVKPALIDKKINVASERLDAIISAVFHLPRSKAQAVVESEKVFVDGKIASNCGIRLKIGAKISVRGFGKFIYDGVENESRKGRLFVCVRIYS